LYFIRESGKGEFYIWWAERGFDIAMGEERAFINPPINTAALPSPN